MTQDVYMTRGKVHTQVTDLLDAAIRRINGPSELACPRKLALMKCAVRVSNPGPAD
jgi:hypothetical protein